jgi:hypothetical protein
VDDAPLERRPARMNSSVGQPELSVIFPTDTYETIKPGLTRLRQQTIADRIEVILVAPSAKTLAPAMGYESDFAAFRILEVSSISPLGIPRAVGIRAATAPFVFVGETHSFLHTDAAGKLLGTIVEGHWDGVTPGFENGNPNGVLSWSAFLAAYGRWSATLPAGEIEEAPVYDTLYRRDVLMEMGERLVPMLSGGDDLRRALRARGRRLYFCPMARIDHLNLARPRPWLHEHFLIGLMIGSRRARSWPWWRRLGYIAGAWLIPLILFRRNWPGVQQVAKARQLPAGTIPAIFLIYTAKAAGELVGYAGGGNANFEEVMNHYEVRRIDYLA